MIRNTYFQFKNIHFVKLFLQGICSGSVFMLYLAITVLELTSHQMVMLLSLNVIWDHFCATRSCWYWSGKPSNTWLSAVWLIRFKLDLPLNPSSLIRVFKIHLGNVHIWVLDKKVAYLYFCMLNLPCTVCFARCHWKMQCFCEINWGNRDVNISNTKFSSAFCNNMFKGTSLKAAQTSK